MKPLTGNPADYFAWRRYVVLNRIKRQQQDLVRRRRVFA